MLCLRIERGSVNLCPVDLALLHWSKDFRKPEDCRIGGVSVDFTQLRRFLFRSDIESGLVTDTGNGSELSHAVRSLVRLDQRVPSLKDGELVVEYTRVDHRHLVLGKSCVSRSKIEI